MTPTTNNQSQNAFSISLVATSIAVFLLFIGDAQDAFGVALLTSLGIIIVRGS